MYASMRNTRDARAASMSRAALFASHVSGFSQSTAFFASMHASAFASCSGCGVAM